MIYEAMERLRFRAFEKTLSTLEKGEVHAIDMTVQEDKERRQFMEICTSGRVVDIKKLYDQFIEKESEKIPYLHFGPSTSKWYSYCYSISERQGHQTGRCT